MQGGRQATSILDDPDTTKVLGQMSVAAPRPYHNNHIHSPRLLSRLCIHRFINTKVSKGKYSAQRLTVAH